MLDQVERPQAYEIRAKIYADKCPLCNAPLVEKEKDGKVFKVCPSGNHFYTTASN